MKEPVRHHYIPQFILKNFCFDEYKHLNYFDIAKNELSVKETTEVFMERNLYRDEVNYKENPVQLENDLSKYEMEMSKIIKDRFLDSDTFGLTIDEDERLKLFLAIMTFRAKTTRDKISNTDEADREFYTNMKQDESFYDRWIRNLELIVKCRSISEVMRNAEIDKIIKAAMIRDTFGLFGLYFIVAERRGHEDFFIGDCYPVTTFGIFDGGVKVPMFSYFPISPSRVIILAANGVEGAPRDMQDYDSGFLRKPVIVPNSNQFKFTVRKIYEDKVKIINKNMFEATKEIGGNIAFRDNNRISVV